MSLKELGKSVISTTTKTVDAAGKGIDATGNLTESVINTTADQVKNIGNDVSAPSLKLINNGLTVLSEFLVQNKLNISNLLGAPIMIASNVAGGTNDILTLLLRSPLNAISVRLAEYSEIFKAKREVERKKFNNKIALDLKRQEIDQIIAMYKLTVELEKQKKMIEGVIVETKAEGEAQKKGETVKAEGDMVNVEVGKKGEMVNVGVEVEKKGEMVEVDVAVEKPVLEVISKNIDGLVEAKNQGDEIDKKILGGKKVYLTKKINKKGTKKSKKQNNKKRKTKTKN